MNEFNTVESALIIFKEPTFYQRFIGTMTGVLLIILTISLLKKFKMREEQGLLWLLGGTALILLSIFPSLLKLVTLAIGAGNPVTALFAGCIIFLITQNLFFSLVLSQQKKQIQNLAIELGLREESKS